MHLNLWVQPLAKDDITTNSSCLEAEECDEDALPLGDAACFESVERCSVQRIAELLSVSRYSNRWPLMPLSELRATSDVHPHCTDHTGSPIRVLLDTKVFPSSDGRCCGLARDGVLIPDANGYYPAMPCCYDCSFALRASVPRLPKRALANDNLMLHGKRVSTMTFTMLALARMIVRQIIAEPYKKSDPSFQTEGLTQQHHSLASSQMPGIDHVSLSCRAKRRSGIFSRYHFNCFGRRKTRGFGAC